MVAVSSTLLFSLLPHTLCTGTVLACAYQVVYGAPVPPWLQGVGSTLLLESFGGFGVQGTNVTLLHYTNSSHDPSSAAPAPQLPFPFHPPAVQLNTANLLEAPTPAPAPRASPQPENGKRNILALALAIPLSFLGVLVLGGVAWLLVRKHRRSAASRQQESSSGVSHQSKEDKFDEEAPRDKGRGGEHQGLLVCLCFTFIGRAGWSS